jgi:hypothetical protein
MQQSAECGLPVAAPALLVLEREVPSALIVSRLPCEARPLVALLEEAVDVAAPVQNALATCIAHCHLAELQLGDSVLKAVALLPHGTGYRALLTHCEGVGRPESFVTAERMTDLEVATDQLTDLLYGAKLDLRAFVGGFVQAYHEWWQWISRMRLFEDKGLDGARLTRRDQLPELHREAAKQGGHIGLILRFQMLETSYPKLLLRMLTGIETGPARARALLRDIFRYRVWLEFSSGKSWPRALAANRWLNEVFHPAVASLPDLATALPGVSPTQS